MNLPGGVTDEEQEHNDEQYNGLLRLIRLLLGRALSVMHCGGPVHHTTTSLDHPVDPVVQDA